MIDRHLFFRDKNVQEYIKKTEERIDETLNELNFLEASDTAILQFSFPEKIPHRIIIYIKKMYIAGGWSVSYVSHTKTLIFKI